MIAAGLDLGGTKIEAQIFDSDWKCVDRRRISTPGEYGALVLALAEQIAWAEGRAGRRDLPVGISAAGLVNPLTGLALTANLAATGRPFPQDITKNVGRPVTYINDCRALTLSEAIFGAARGRRTAVGLILGTGIGGGVAVEGRLLPGPTATGGEFGHFALPAGPVVARGLPVIRCGCGQMGCTETLIAGPGMTRIAEVLTGRSLTPPEIAAARHEPGVAPVWTAWTELLAELVKTLILVVDPDCIVLGGGLSKIDGLVPALDAALRKIQLPGFGIPALLLAEGGDASGARGAAYWAVQEARA